MSSNQMPQQNVRGRVKRLFFWAIGLVLLIALSLILALASLKDGGGLIYRLQLLADSPGIQVFRWGLYLMIWFQWQRLVSYAVGREVTREEVRATRRPLLILMIAYEVFFAFNLLGKVTGG